MISGFLQRLAYGCIWLAFSLGRLAVKIFPRRLLYSLSEAIAGPGYYLFYGFRKRSARNLSLALGEQIDARDIAAISRRALRNFLRDFVELGLALEAAPERIRAEIPVVGRAHLDRALAKGKGAIALSAHLGNFFLVGTRLAIEGYPTYVLVKPSRDGRLAQLRARYRLKIGQRTIHARPRRQASRELVQILRRNELAIIIADEYRSGDGIDVPFFGRTVTARRGPATLALRTGAAVVPAYLVRDQRGRLALNIEPEIEMSRSGDIKADVRENTMRMTQWVERVVRSYPDQWNWMHVHWRQGPVGAAVGKEDGYEGFACQKTKGMIP